jgi:hypothetical protein
MIWTKDQLLSNLIRHVSNNSSIAYYVELICNPQSSITEQYKVSYKPFKNATKIKTIYSYNYWIENFNEYVNDSLSYDIHEIEQDDSLTEKQKEKEIDKCNKYSEKRSDNTEEFKDYLNEAISELHLVPNEEIDI